MPRVPATTSAAPLPRTRVESDNPPQQKPAAFVDVFRASGPAELGGRSRRLRPRKLTDAAPAAARGGRRAYLARRPDFLLVTARSAALAARGVRIPSFMVADYDHAELASFRRAGTTVLHPDDRLRGFHRKGFPPRRVIPFEGIKEDASWMAWRT